MPNSSSNTENAPDKSSAPENTSETPPSKENESGLYGPAFFKQHPDACYTLVNGEYVVKVGNR